MINLIEFSEATGCNEENLDAEEAEAMAHESSAQKNELKNDIEKSQSPLKKSNSKEDLYQKSIDQTIDQYESPDNKSNEKNADNDKE